MHVNSHDCLQMWESTCFFCEMSWKIWRMFQVATWPMIFHFFLPLPFYLSDVKHQRDRFIAQWLLALEFHALLVSESLLWIGHLWSHSDSEQKLAVHRNDCIWSYSTWVRIKACPTLLPGHTNSLWTFITTQSGKYNKGWKEVIMLTKC